LAPIRCLYIANSIPSTPLSVITSLKSPKKKENQKFVYKLTFEKKSSGTHMSTQHHYNACQNESLNLILHWREK
jgi:hypothetical protein